MSSSSSRSIGRRSLAANVVLHLKHRRLVARGRAKGTAFRVFVGSHANAVVKTITTTSYLARREALIAKGTLQPDLLDPTRLILMKAVTFGSASEAATVLIGGQSYGRMSWVARHGQPPSLAKKPQRFNVRAPALARKLRDLAQSIRDIKGDPMATAWCKHLTMLSNRLDRTLPPTPRRTRTKSTARPESLKSDSTAH